MSHYAPIDDPGDAVSFAPHRSDRGHFRRGDDTVPDYPEVDLWYAVLVQALKDAARGGKKEKPQAIQWLKSPSMPRLAWMIGLDPDFVWETYRKMV